MAKIPAMSGGGGIGTATELLSAPTQGTQNSTISLTDDISQYNLVEFVVAVDEGTNDFDHLNSIVFTKDMIDYAISLRSSISRGSIDISGLYTVNNWFCWNVYIDPNNKTQLHVLAKLVGSGWNISMAYIVKIIGYK